MKMPVLTEKLMERYATVAKNAQISDAERENSIQTLLRSGAIQKREDYFDENTPCMTRRNLTVTESGVEFS